MFNSKHHGKIKNDKIMRWRIELNTFDFDIVYCCGEENIPADALSHIKYLSMSIESSEMCMSLFVTQVRHEWHIL